MRRVGIWASGLLASAIPFVFVGAVIAFVACVFDAVGQHAPPVRSGASFQAEAEQVLTVTDAPRDVAQLKPSKHAQSDRHHHHTQSRSRVRPSPFKFGWPFVNHFAKPNYPARSLANLQ